MTTKTILRGALPLVAVAYLLTVPRSLSARESDWLGVPTPEERQALRRKAAADFVDLGFGMLPLVGPASTDYPDIQGGKLFKYVNDIVEFSEQSRRDGNILWGRICGTKYQHETAAYIQKKFTEYGLENIHADGMMRNPQWWPTMSRLAVVLDGPGGKSEYVLRSAFPAPPSPSTPHGGIEGELVDVGLGRPVDLLGKDVKGKIVVMRSQPRLGTIYLTYTGETIPDKLARMGAAAIVTIVDSPGNAQTFLYDAFGETVPAYVLGNDDGTFVEELIGRAGGSRLRMRMELEVEYKPPASTENVYGMVRGTTDEYVVVMAHQDGWFDAAIDNASGLSTMLVLAQHYAGQSKQAKPRRNILFVATAGHHMALGREHLQHPPPGYPGSASPGTETLIAKNGEILSKAVVVLNCEHTASVATQVGGDSPMMFTGGFFQQKLNTENARTLAITNRSPLLIEYFGQAVDRYGIVVAQTTRHSPYGDASIMQKHAPTVVLIETLAWYHSTADTPDLIPPTGLERTAKAFAFFLDKVDGTSRVELERAALPLQK